MKWIYLGVVALALMACTGAQGEQGTPGADHSADIDEIYLQLAYLACIHDADVVLGDAEDEEDSVFSDYVTDNVSYAEYEEAYAVYERAYDAYDKESDRCWEEYQEASEVE